MKRSRLVNSEVPTGFSSLHIHPVCHLPGKRSGLPFKAVAHFLTHSLMFFLLNRKAGEEVGSGEIRQLGGGH